MKIKYVPLTLKELDKLTICVFFSLPFSLPERLLACGFPFVSLNVIAASIYPFLLTGIGSQTPHILKTFE